MHPYKLAILATLGACAFASCGDDGSVTTQETTGGSTGATTGDSSTPTTTSPTTVDPTTGVDNTGPEPTTGTTESPVTTTDTTGTPDTTTDGTSTTAPDTTTGDDTTAGVDTTTDGSSSTGVAEPSCEDGVLNQDESDVDCGGDVCTPCAADQLCNDSTDCVSEACVAGVCVMPACKTDVDCVMLEDQCNTGVCNQDSFTCEAMPAMDGLLCDDDDLCTATSTCVAGACEPGPQIDCAAQNGACTVGQCDPQDGLCKAVVDPDKEGVACNDNNACTAGEKCQAGVCGDPNDKGYVFHENFSDPNPGWVLDTNWEIGAAVASPAGTGNTGTDPALDHTPTNDNKLAGQLIGALITNATTPTGMYRCLTTPKVDTSNMPTSWITFWRHLHSDYANTWAIQRIEVWDGAKWVLLEQGYNSNNFTVINDAAWTEVKFDITAYKNAALQVRICHNRVSSNAYNYGGWSVDDVTIAPIACTP